MKTTVEIDNALLIEAKKRAIELHKPLRALIEEGLRMYLKGKSAAARHSKKTKIKWVTVKGGIPDDLDIDNREAMHEWLRNNPE